MHYGLRRRRLRSHAEAMGISTKDLYNLHKFCSRKRKRRSHRELRTRRQRKRIVETLREQTYNEYLRYGYYEAPSHLIAKYITKSMSKFTLINIQVRPQVRLYIQGR